MSAKKSDQRLKNKALDDVVITPALIIDLKKIKENYDNICKLFNQKVDVYYAMKANSEPGILKTLSDAGCGFEVSSKGELEQLIDLKIDKSKIIISNPLKKFDLIGYCRGFGIDEFTIDSFAEVDKIEDYASGSKVIIRIVVDNTGSDWPLSKKFGIDSSKAIDLIKYSRSKGLIPHGLTFHVGSQCLNINNWSNALITCKEIFRQSENIGEKLKLLNIGGGLPVKHVKEIPKVENIAKVILNTINDLFGDEVELQIEPGRFIVGDAGLLSTTVIAKADRGTEKWIYVDVGVFNGLMETIEGFDYEIEAFEDDIKKINATIAGPSCDSVDTIFKNKQIPDQSVGKRLYFLNAGAYTLSYASDFNGFGPPKVYYT